jgi:hypothetical protein
MLQACLVNPAICMYKETRLTVLLRNGAMLNKCHGIYFGPVIISLRMLTTFFGVLKYRISREFHLLYLLRYF